MFRWSDTMRAVDAEWDVISVLRGAARIGQVDGECHCCFADSIRDSIRWASPHMGYLLNSAYIHYPFAITVWHAFQNEFYLNRYFLAIFCQAIHFSDKICWTVWRNLYPLTASSHQFYAAECSQAKKFDAILSETLNNVSLEHQIFHNVFLLHVLSVDVSCVHRHRENIGILTAEPTHYV